MSNEMKRLTDDAVFRLRDLAGKLERGDAFIQSMSESNRRNVPLYLVLPNVRIVAETANGTLEYNIVLPVHVRPIDRQKQRVKPCSRGNDWCPVDCCTGHGQQGPTDKRGNWPPCHAKPREQWCDRDGPGEFMGHTCYP